ncbi:MAG: DNA double-strand break repair nuclease NurA [Ezakiella sp.]|nr:DNA double-strand break repair nuclease NurA [Ezakiella sp.]
MNNSNREDIFKEFNDKLRENFNAIDRSSLRDRLKDIGEFYNARHLKKEELLKYMPGSVGAVDGSVNSFGGAEPNNLSLLSACYLPDLLRERFDNYRLISPLVGDDISPIVELAKLEIETAYEGIKKYNSKALLLDGGFIRFLVADEYAFLDLIEECKIRDALLIGVIEDIKSKQAAEGIGESCYDREIFFGLLKKNEAFILGKDYLKNENIGTAYFRPAWTPEVIAIDYPILDEGRIYSMIDLVLALTPESSRGIPMILDMVDKYTKLSDKDMERFILTYIDEDLRRVYLDEARKKRWM